MKLKKREIRSKATFQKGKIERVNERSIYVDFGYDAPIKLSYEKFLELIYCEEEVEQEIRRRLEEEWITKHLEIL